MAVPKLVPFAQGLRPFFLLAGIDAIFNMAVWLAVYFDVLAWPRTAVPAMFWHAHEMMFGFVGAAIGGFLLTAVPGWTGRSSYAGAPLVTLALIWLGGRVAMLPFAVLPPVLSAIVDLAFFPAVVIALAPPLVRARKMRNAVFLLLLALLFAADVAFQLGRLGLFDNGEQAGLLGAVDLVLLLVAVVGGRIIPAFTRSGLSRRGLAVDIDPDPWLEAVAIASVAAVGLADMLNMRWGDAASLVAAVLNAARWVQWKGWRSWREPLIWVLHLGYAWLIAGLALKAFWLALHADFAANWLHALTVGVFATMILAVMTRASLGHTGRALATPRPMVAGYGLVTAAAAFRVFGPALAPTHYEMWVALAGGCWIAAFSLFVIVYGPILTLPRVDGRAG